MWYFEVQECFFLSYNESERGAEKTLHNSYQTVSSVREIHKHTVHGLALVL